MVSGRPGDALPDRRSAKASRSGGVRPSDARRRAVATRPARGSGEQAGPDEKRLTHLLDGVGLLTHRDGERGQADRPAAEGSDQGA